MSINVNVITLDKKDVITDVTVLTKIGNRSDYRMVRTIIKIRFTEKRENIRKDTKRNYEFISNDIPLSSANSLDVQNMCNILNDFITKKRSNTNDIIKKTWLKYC